MQFLKKLLGGWNSFARSSESQDQCLPLDEVTGRFFFHKRDYSQLKLKPKPKIFSPNLENNKLETSVCRVSNISEGRIWQIGNKVRDPLKACARADINVSAIVEVGLHARAAPEDGYSEHAVIIGWPDEKDKQREICVGLAYNSSLVFPPD